MGGAGAGGFLPSKECTVLPPVGCRVHLSAGLATAAAAALRKGESMTQRDFA